MFPAYLKCNVVVSLSMIRQFSLFVFFCISIIGCQDSVNIIEDPNEPYHKIHIDGEVQFHGEISWSAPDDSLDTTIEVENIGTDTARIEAGPCSFNVVAYNDNGEAVWYNRAQKNYVCPDKMIIYVIEPEVTKELTDQIYISGTNWYWDIPAGDWNFVIETKTENGKSISFSANSQ